MSDTVVLLPGDEIEVTSIPISQKRRIGPGIQHDTTKNEYTCTIAGVLEADFRKKSAKITVPHTRYIPRPGDLVIAQAILPYLAFEGATKKTRPQLKSGDLVYAKVISANKNMEVELSCVNPSTGKAEPDGLGPLAGGMLFEVSIGLAERLLRKQNVNAMDELGAKIAGGFEIAVGKNGKVWVDCPEAGVRGIVAVGKCLRQIDETHLQEKEQKRLANRIVNEIGTG